MLFDCYDAPRNTLLLLVKEVLYIFSLVVLDLRVSFEGHMTSLMAFNKCTSKF